MAKTRATRQGDVYGVLVRRHTGMILIGQTRTTPVRGSLEQCRAALKAAQRHNFLFGWWGIISLLVYNPMAIGGNVRAKSDLEALAAGSSAPTA